MRQYYQANLDGSGSNAGRNRCGGTSSVENSPAADPTREKMTGISALFTAGLVAYLAGAGAGLAGLRYPRALCARSPLGLALAGAAARNRRLGRWRSAGGQAIAWSLPFGNPAFLLDRPAESACPAFSTWRWASWRRRSRSIRSAICGAWRDAGASASSAFFYNVLLLSLTLVFTAANAFFFLVAWEVMALSAYCLVSFEHEKHETRRAGMLFLDHVARRHRAAADRRS